MKCRTCFDVERVPCPLCSGEEHEADHEAGCDFCDGRGVIRCEECPENSDD